MRAIAVMGAMIVSVSLVGAQAPPMSSPAWYAQFSGPYSQPTDPFRIVGNIYYVGAVNIASYLVTTPEGHILIDTGMNEMHEVIRKNVETLGFKTSDIEIMLTTQAHFDHVEGHRAMQQLTGARVFAVVGDVEALSTGRDTSALGARGWDAVKVDRVLDHGDTVELGGATLRAIHTPGHTQGTTTWVTRVEDGGRSYTVAFFGSMTPNDGVPLLGNPRHKTVIEDTQKTFARLKAEKPPDIYLVGHPRQMFEGKGDRIKAGARPHPLLNAAEWVQQIAAAEAGFAKRVAAERARAGQQANLASLIPAAEVIVAAEIGDTDYSRTPSDGPMTARATVLATVRGKLPRNQSFRFTETAWVGPSYRKGEVRILFLEAAGPGSWRILSNLFAKANVFVERDAIPLLNVNSLRRALEQVPAPTSGNVVLTRDTLK